MKKIFFLGRLRKVVVFKGEEGIWFTFKGGPVFKTLKELFEVRFPHEPKPVPSRVEYWTRVIGRTGLKKTRWIPDYFGETRLPCIPAFKLLRLRYPQYVLREADRWFYEWWNGENINEVRMAFLGKGKRVWSMDPLLYSYLCDLQSLTQAVYRKLFPKGKVVLYRGVSGSFAVDTLLNLARSGKSKVQLYPLSSFSESARAAQKFAESTGFIIRQEVPISRIKYSWRVVGMGEEKEVIAAVPHLTLKDVRSPRRVTSAVIFTRGPLGLEFWKDMKTRSARRLVRIYQTWQKLPHEASWDDFRGICDYVHLPRYPSKTGALIPFDEWLKFIKAYRGEKIRFRRIPVRSDIVVPWYEIREAAGFPKLEEIENYFTTERTVRFRDFTLRMLRFKE